MSFLLPTVKRIRMPISDEDYAFVENKFKKQMKHYVELRDFRTFLLFNLIDESDSMIQKIMEGGRSMRTLLYDNRGSYIYEYALTKSRLMFYIKAPDLENTSVLDRETHQDFFV